eukprot:FR736240.1.p1 GENE.FR736240.1~~FR736240.1.p1  ORF type:complete len:304 (+),score=13.03 FR736240.1:138-914(+)
MAKRNANQISAEFHTSVAECPVCMDNMSDEIFSCKEGHSICGECLKQLTAPKKCPECRGPIGSGDRNRAIERIVAQITLPCKWAPASDSAEDGCDFEGTKDVRTAHEQICEFRRHRCPIHKSCQATMLSSEMCNHITSAHISYIPTTLEEYVVSTQGFKSERNWEDFNETGCVFNKIYRLEDREQWALVYLIAGTERDSGRLVIAASTLAATRNMDTESLRLGVQVPLQDDEGVTLRLKPQKSTGSPFGWTAAESPNY